MKRIILSFIILVTSHQLFSQNKDSLISYQIYSDILEEYFSNPKIDLLTIQDSTKFVVFDTIDIPDFLRNGKKGGTWIFNGPTPRLISDTLFDLIKQYNKINKIRDKISLNFTTKNKVIIIIEKQTDEILKNDKGNGWENYYKKYKKSSGIIELSKIAISKDKNMALFYVGNQQHYLAECGVIFYCKKVKNKWQIVDKYLIWVS